MSDTSAQDNAAFQEFMQHIRDVSASISTDTGEWDALSGICKNPADVKDYAQRCQEWLWTDGEDQSSWTLIKQGAQTALAQDNHNAIVTVFTSFLNITDPSHNSDQWGDLKQTAYNLLDRINNDPFHILMVFVRRLADGVTTDAGEWAKYGEICADAAANGIPKYVSRCSELWTDGLDQFAWSAIKDAAAAASSQDDRHALVTILYGFLRINSPSHNSDQWRDLKNRAYDILTSADFNLYVDDSTVQFIGTDTRGRRLLVDPDKLPFEMNMSYLIKRDNFPATFVTKFGYKACHVEYYMRLYANGADGSAHFIVTHSQDYGGYVGLARVPATNVGTGSSDNKITVAEPDFAGDMIWYDHLDGFHPGGCNHPGNGGQIGSKVVLVGQDWTKNRVGVYSVEPVGHGSKILFYDFGMLGSGGLPTMGNGAATSDAYLGCLTTEQLNIAPGDDGEVSTVLVEQGPDGLFYMIAANRNQTVFWVSAELVPDIGKWRQLPIWSVNSMEDGSAMLAWAKFAGGKQALYYVKAGDAGMNFMPIRYEVVDGKVLSIFVAGNPDHSTNQDEGEFKGDESWVYDDGGFYVGVDGGIALHGAYLSVNDEKGPSGSETPCVQVRTWYSN